MREALQQALDAMVGADQIDTDMRDAIVACREALKKEPVAWIAKQEDGGLLLWDASYKLIQEGYEFNKHKRLKYYPLYLGEIMAEIKQLKAELASNRVGFTKVSPYEPGSRGRFSI